MPDNAKQAIECAEAIAAGKTEWGSRILWPAERMRAGDWSPAQWFDGTLAKVAAELEANTRLEAAATRYVIGPAGQRIQDAYEVCKSEVSGAVPGFHSVSSKLRQTIRAQSDVWYRPRADKQQLAARYSSRRANLLVSMRFDTISGRLTGLWTAEPSFGWWVPVAVSDENSAKSLAAWWNSTPVRLMLLNRRARKLTYPTWQVAHLREIRVPKQDSEAWVPLRNAFDQMCDRELLPMKHANKCEVRREIDEAAAVALGVESEILSDWRERLSREPTITNQRAL